MKRILALLLCLTLVMGMFSGCDAESDEPHVPTGDALVMEGQDPDSVGPQKEEKPQEFSLAYYPNRGMNPLTCNEYTNRVLFSLIYQNLFNVRADYSTEPILCSSYRVSANYRTWVFFVDEKATFSDGTPVTVEDVNGQEIGMDELAAEDTIQVSMGEDAAAKSILLLPDESRDFC